MTAAPQKISSEHALPASIEELPGGGARVTIGAIVNTYANAGMARSWLEAQEKMGAVRLQPKEAAC